MSRDNLLTPTSELLRDNVADAVAVCDSLLDADVVSTVSAVSRDIVESLRAGGKVLMCGNGGSAADAQHLAAEFIGRFSLDRHALPAIALSDNIAAVTAVGNDYCYGDVFLRGVQGLGRPGDVLVGLSTSGSSLNVVTALKAAQELGLITVALVGVRDCAMAQYATHVIPVAGRGTARIQEGHMLVGHTIVESVERELCGAF
jgi:D-sedoheptulose 7-phosphate isomerase